MNSPGGTAETGSYRGRKALVWGLGRHGGGVAVTRYLASSGATVTVVDEADEHSLARAVEELADLNEVEFRLGESLAGTNTVQSGDASREVHELFAQHDLVVVNPAVPNSHPAYRVLRDFAKPTITSELDLLLCELADVPLIAVSGSNGKSSVCLWIVRLLRLLEPTKWVALGGNFEPGLSPECPRNLLSVLSSSKWATSKWDLDRDRRKPDLCVLELSSFQLARVDANLLNPKVAAITNLTPNHLDWHQSLDDYVMAKSRLFESVSPTVGKIVLPRCPDDPITKLWQDARHSITPDIGRGPSCWSESERANAATTAAVVKALGYSVSDDVLTEARPNVPHRQTLIEPHDGIRFHDGLRFIDDSAATTPEAVYPLLKQYGSTDRSS